MTEKIPSYKQFLGFSNGGTRGPGAGYQSNNFGDGSSGILNTTGDVSLSSGDDDSNGFIRQYQAVSINTGHTVQMAGRRKFLVIYSQGDLTMAGTGVLQHGKGANVAGAACDIERFAVNTLFTNEMGIRTTFSIPAAGATGPAGLSANGNGTDGTAGTNGQTGSGGAGGRQGAGGNSGGGGTGTGFAGGSGGGASANAAGATDGGANGGAGGAAAGANANTKAAGGSGALSGGAGSQGGGSGSAGSGSILIVICGGKFSTGASNVIKTPGTNGGAASGGSTSNCGGGGSGGGRTVVLYRTAGTISGSVTAPGGSGGTASGGTTNRTGGAGGAGTVSGPTAIW